MTESNLLSGQRFPVSENTCCDLEQGLCTMVASLIVENFREDIAMPLKTWALADMAGIGDLAKRYKVRPSTVANWRARYEDFPEPLTFISGAPVFSLKAVAKWHRSKNWLKGKHNA
jgi:hypothetical protein